MCSACAAGSYSYGRAAACATCASGATLISSTLGCQPSATMAAGPQDTTFYLSGSSIEGSAAFSTIGTPLGVSFTTGVFGAASGAISFGSGSYLSVPGGDAPSTLPNGNMPWSVSAWVQCVAPATWAVAVGWGATDNSSSAAALVVGGPTTLANGTLIKTLAGGGSAFADGTGTSASFSSAANGLAVIASSGVVVVADGGNRVIRLVSPSGVTSTLAGRGCYPFGLGFTAIKACTGGVEFSDGMGTAATFGYPAATFGYPAGVAVFPSSGNIVVADSYNHAIRLVTPAGFVTTFAGSAGVFGAADGTGTAALFYFPTGVAVVPSTGLTIIADSENNLIRLITPSGVTTTIAGSGGRGLADGTGTSASFSSPIGVAVIASTSVIVVADTGNCAIRLIAPSGITTTLAGGVAGCGHADGAGLSASFSQPVAVAVVPSTGNVVVADSGDIRP